MDTIIVTTTGDLLELRDSDGYITVSGDIVIECDVPFVGVGEYIYGIDVHGSITCRSDIVILGYFKCSTDMAFNRNVRCDGDLTCGGDFSCDGGVTCSGDISIGGNVYCYGRLWCDGEFKFGGRSEIEGSIYFGHSNTSIAKPATVRSMRRNQRILADGGKVTSVVLSAESLAALKRAADLGLSQRDAINLVLVAAWGQDSS